MKFWDSSAIVPLLVGERMTPVVRAILASDRQIHVWWGTEIECTSTISRLERDGVARPLIQSAFERLSILREDWSEITPGALVRDTAKRLLRVHPLRAADSLQLAAAWVLSDHDPGSITIISLDDRLLNAARREGFLVAPEEA